jgi:hypothetical protein
MVARHRLIKTLNLDGNDCVTGEGYVLISSLDALDDDALSDGGEDYISPEHQGTPSCAQRIIV